MKKSIIFLLFLFNISVSFSQVSLSEAVDFTVTDVEGNKHHLFDYLNDGKYVLIDFFFTTCAICQEIAPKINEVYEYFGCNSASLIVLGIEYENNDADVIAFNKAYGSAYPSVSGLEGGGRDVCIAYKPNAYATITLIAPDKQIVFKDIWPINSAQTVIDTITPLGPQKADCAATGIYENLSNIDIYPVPANDFIKIANANGYYLSVYNTNGQIVLQKDITSNTETVDLQKLNTGIYTLKLSNEFDLKSYTISVVK